MRMGEPSFIARIFEFASALLGYWWALAAGIIFAAEPMIEPLLGERWKRHFDSYLNKESRNKIFRWLSILAILLASFFAYDDVSKRDRDLRRNSIGSRLDISKIWTSNENGKDILQIRLDNRSLIPVDSPNGEIHYEFVTDKINEEKENYYMKTIIARSNEQKHNKVGNQINPGF